MVTLRDVPLRSVPVAEPQTALDEVTRLLESDPLKTVALVGDEMYMGIFDEEALRSDLIPRRVDPATLAAGPYARTPLPGHPEMTAEHALALMQRRNEDVLPVVENNTYLGVVTRADLERRAGAKL
jgi:CBS domain-containing protein